MKTGVAWRGVVAEMLGSGWLLICGCGTAVLAAGFPVLGVGFMGIALAFGAAMVTAGLATGRRPLAFFTPVLATGMLVSGDLSLSGWVVCVLAQVAGSLAGAALLWLMVRDIPTFDVHMGFSSNGYGPLSPGGFSLASVALAEALMAGFSVLMVLRTGSTGNAVMVAGGCIALTVLVTVTLDNAAVSPARSTAVAVFAGGEWLSQLWLFWVAPLAGAVAGGGVYRLLRAPCVTRPGAGKQ
ncbi:aquaporin [Salmonella enterica subsp. enterica serovar Uganda]|nr:aquaporin [Salmonella enterica]EAC1542077.1 aquaporin [Salmonella enterica subsp. enterica]EBO2751034.1 aquaporin [Salmonella enterica subsp. enterica serovar Agona]EDE1788927.1 aquaporin [Salmonella enterica subsp. enterica serovar Enteritidis]EEJ6011814.1 aquaporin [Salmonella enterica subsp. enterica serovar Meleagridis]EGC3414678.1 aquaporin [Salmonella enterica subsp. enterica serovar Uganda]EIE4434097.1 aquaporin [Salmonella enterica subsp. enterica serovar Altona]EKO4796200.1 aquap